MLDNLIFNNVYFLIVYLLFGNYWDMYVYLNDKKFILKILFVIIYFFMLKNMIVRFICFFL